MTTRSITSIIALICCSFQAQATEYQFVAEDHSPATRFCVAAAEDDIDGLRSQIRKMRQSPHHQYKAIVNGVRCNGQVAARFAQSYGAAETFTYLYKLTDKRHRTGVPHTSVEDVAQGGQAPDSPERVVVQVTGR